MHAVVLETKNQPIWINEFDMSRYAIDPREFRSALGEYATGVSVITTIDKDGVPAGVTVNSFASVSLEPPLILWSLDRSSRSFAAFMDRRPFSVHVLSKEQEALSRRFGAKNENKFAGLSHDTNHFGVPVIENCAARFDCEVHDTFDGGDHLIIVGLVRVLRHTPNEPLVFHRGQYAAIGN